MLEFRPWL